MEQDIVNNLKSRLQKLEEELTKVVSPVHVKLARYQYLCHPLRCRGNCEYKFHYLIIIL